MCVRLLFVVDCRGKQGKRANIDQTNFGELSQSSSHLGNRKLELSKQKLSKTWQTDRGISIDFTIRIQYSFLNLYSQNEALETKALNNMTGRSVDFNWFYYLYIRFEIGIRKLELSKQKLSTTWQADQGISIEFIICFLIGIRYSQIGALDIKALNKGSCLGLAVMAYDSRPKVSGLITAKVIIFAVIVC